MNNKNSIRKTIFKDELRYIFSVCKDKLTEVEKDRIVHSIFENPLTISKQYILKKELNTLEDLTTEINKITTDSEVAGAINTLFLVQDDLELPTDLKNIFLRNEKIGVFVGAGVSKLINIPLWRELGDKAIEYLRIINRINYFEYQRIISDVIDPKQKLTIFHKILPKNTPDAKKFYHDSLKKSNRKGIENPYNLLVEIDWVKITSNIDNEFYDALNKKFEYFLKISNEKEKDIKSINKHKKANKAISKFNVSSMNYDTIYQIHGSMDDLEHTTLTTEDYIEAYYSEESELKIFLTELFKEYTIVFIGYGLEEFSILEHIIKNTRRHYALIGTYLNEVNLFRLHSEYFSALHITPIPFYLDFNGHKRLISVLDSWNQKIKDARSKEYYQNIMKIDELVD